MWDTGVFSRTTVSWLSNAVFFYYGKEFAFRSMDSHRQCQAEQFQIVYDDENKRKFIKYTPRLSKHVQGGLKDWRFERVPIKQFRLSNEALWYVLRLITGQGSLYRNPLESTSLSGPRFNFNSLPVNQMPKHHHHSSRVRCCKRL